jgi:hypothetical protein
MKWPRGKRDSTIVLDILRTTDTSNLDEIPHFTKT